MQVAKGKPLVTWNAEMDTLRGDLGLVSFPPKDLHYRCDADLAGTFAIATCTRATLA